MITATTVGYGDVWIADSKDAKLFACLHIVVSVSWIASLISWIDNLSSKRASQLQRANLILHPPQREEIMALDHEGKGVDQLGLVVGMMMLLGVELCGEPLKWADVRPFMLQHERFDVSKTGRLSSDDLDKYTDAMLAQKKRIAEDAKLSPRERAKRKEGGGLLSRLGGSFKGVGSSLNSSLKVLPPVVTAVRTADDVPANGSPSAVRPFDEA